MAEFVPPDFKVPLGLETSELVPDETEFAGTRWWGFDEVQAGGRVEFDPHLPRFIDKLRGRAA